MLLMLQTFFQVKKTNKQQEENKNKTNSALLSEEVPTDELLEKFVDCFDVKLRKISSITCIVVNLLIPFIHSTKSSMSLWA